MVPKSGQFAGIAVVEADSVSLTRAFSTGRSIVGSVVAMWGAVVLVDAAYEDRPTMRALSINGVFESGVDQPLRMDFDGLRDTENRPVKRARLVTTSGSKIYAKGVLT